MILHGDCIDMLKTLEANSIEARVDSNRELTHTQR